MLFRSRATPLTDDEIATIDKRYPNAGIGVVGGYRGLVPIDIDTDDPDIQAAIDTVLPKYLVAKRGRRGITVFYRDASGGIKARKFKRADGSMIMEVLTTGQAVVPPTIHPETQRPYQWVTECTLFEVSIDELPEREREIAVAAVQDLAAAAGQTRPIKRGPCGRSSQQTFQFASALLAGG